MGNIRQTVHPLVLTGLILGAVVGSVLYANHRAERNFEMGEVAFSEGGYKDAAYHYKSAIRNFPFKGNYYFRLGQSLEASGDKEGAEREYKKARMLGSSN